MKKVLRFIGKTLLWLLYVHITVKDRRMYSMAKHRGYECTDLQDDLFGSTYSFKRCKEPQKRNYMNWREFRTLHKF